MHQIDLQQLEFIDSKLRTIMKEIEEKFGSKVITSLYRIGDTGPHGTLPLRAIDIRSESEKIDGNIVEFINKNWIYDEKRPLMTCALRHDVGQGMHIHIQVSPNTRRVSAKDLLNNSDCKDK